MRDTSAERIEVARLQSAITRHQQSVSAAEAELEALRIAKDKAAAEFDFEEFLHGPLERLDKALHAVHTANQEVAKAAAAGVRVASEFTDLNRGADSELAASQGASVQPAGAAGAGRPSPLRRVYPRL